MDQLKQRTAVISVAIIVGVILGGIFLLANVIRSNPGVTGALTLILVGLFGLTMLVYKSLNRAQLSMSAFGGATKEHHQGLSMKAPWYLLQKPDINMQAEIIITSGGLLVMSWEKFMTERVYEKIAPRIYETKDSILYGSWATAIRPRREGLVNFVLKTPQVAALMVMAEVDLEISDYLATKLTKTVLHKKRDISNQVADIFGGSDEEATSSTEESYGIIISNPRLFDLNLGERSQEAAEKLFEAKKFGEAMKELEKQMTDPDKRANAILIATGMAKKNIFNIEGLDTALVGIAEAFASRGG